jgi:hypothetical protein
MVRTAPVQETGPYPAFPIIRLLQPLEFLDHDEAHLRRKNIRRRSHKKTHAWAILSPDHAGRGFTGALRDWLRTCGANKQRT